VSNSTTTQCLFPDLFDKQVVARFDVDHGSSDGGAVLLKAANRRLGLVEALADCVVDRREPQKVTHDTSELLGQRVYALACGYADCNDAARLGADPIHKALIDRDPVDGDDLGSQPTLSRFENSLGPRGLYRMSEALLERIVQRHRKRLRGKVQQITIDLDVTDDPTHGNQQLSLFNGYYDTYCYLPLLGFISFNDEPEQYLCAALLRSGTAGCSVGAVGMLRRIIRRLRAVFPDIRILVRLDGGFASPGLLDFLDDQPNLVYVVGFPSNAVLRRQVADSLRRVRRRAKRSGKSAREYGHRFYAARSWKHERRIVYKSEVLRYDGRELKDNPRFVVTNLGMIPKRVYELYCRRGEVENRIKELQDGMQIGRTSCSRFWANQFRVLLTTAAYALMQEVRLWAKRTRLARAQIETLRICLIKIGAHVEVSVRRIVLHLPRSFVFLDLWRRIAAVAAGPG
jgi:hypothetical protein